MFPVQAVLKGILDHLMCGTSDELCILEEFSVVEIQDSSSLVSVSEAKLFTLLHERKNGGWHGSGIGCPNVVNIWTTSDIDGLKVTED